MALVLSGDSGFDLPNGAELAVDEGGTGANNDSDARVNLGLGNVDNVSASDLRDRSTHTGTQTLSTISDAGTIASQDANSVNIDGGTIDGTAVNATTLTASGDVNFDSGTLFVDESTNRVGIGTTSPAVKFEVSGAGSVAQLKRTGVATILFGLDGAKNEIFSRDGGTGDFPLAIFTGSSERMRIDSSGHAIIPAGVTLGTSAGVYNAANTLDDYETGTWTPTIITNPGTATTYASFDAIYTKMGNLVSVALKIRGTNGTIGADDDFMQLTGLPFAESGVNAGSMVDASNLVSSGGCLALSTQMQIHFRKQLANTTSAFVALVYRT